MSAYSFPRSVLLHENLHGEGLGFDLRSRCFPGVKTLRVSQGSFGAQAVPCPCSATFEWLPPTTSSRNWRRDSIQACKYLPQVSKSWGNSVKVSTSNHRSTTLVKSNFPLRDQWLWTSLSVAMNLQLLLCISCSRRFRSVPSETPSCNTLYHTLLPFAQGQIF